jgi:integrase
VEKETLAAAAGGDRAAVKAAANIERRRTVARFRVTWRVFDDRSPDGRLRKRSDFDSKGRAQAFAERLRWAGQGVDGWQLDGDDEPVQQATAAAPRYSVFDLTADYWHAHWPEMSPAQRAKVAGRLRTIRQVLVHGSPTAEALSYLAAVSFHGRTEPDKLDEAVRVGRDWLARHSLIVAELNHTTLLPLYAVLVEGRTYGTARTYWAVVRALVSWGCETGKLAGDPLRRLRLPRRTEAEEVDPDRIPSPDEVRRVAWACGLIGGQRHCALPLVLGDGGLRMGEAVALRRRDIEFTERGGAWVSVRTTVSRAPSQYAEGQTTTERPTKGRTQVVTRRTYLSAETAAVLRTHMELFVGTGPEAFVFTGKRGGRLCADTHLRTVWRPAVETAFPAGHRLAKLRRHDLRHAAVTGWLRAGVPPKQCQKMGGWRSLKVMLDVYAGLYGDDAEKAEDAIEDWRRRPAA